MTSASGKKRVLVLYGGQSPEHSVSCVTAAGVLQALDHDRYTAVPIGITRTGQWTEPLVNPLSHTFSGNSMPEVEGAAESVQLVRRIEGSGPPAELLAVDSGGRSRSLGGVDVAFPLLHGPFGEDGTLQGLLELVGLPYVGAGVLASALGMDKHYMKLAFEAAGLTVGPYSIVTARRWRENSAACLSELRDLELPLFVKPARGGSSVGITRVDEWSQLDAAVASAQEYDPKIVVEQGIEGREIECGVLGGKGGGRPRASVCGEIVVRDSGSSHQFYDFRSKYTDGSSTQLSCPADLPDVVSEAIRDQAILAFEALGAEGISRSDFFYTSSGEIIINEVNTMPGFTPISMYPQMWRATGVTYSALIDELLQLALERPVGLR